MCAEGGEPLGYQLPDAAQADDSDGLAEDLGARNDDRFQVCSRREASAAGIWRAADSSNAMACSAALWMFDVGALTTSTPRSVAASDVDVVQPDAGAGDDLSLGARSAPRRRRSWPSAPEARRPRAPPPAASPVRAVDPAHLNLVSPGPSTVD